MSVPDGKGLIREAEAASLREVGRWPEDGRAFYNQFPHRLERAYLLADSARPLEVDLHHRSLMIHVPAEAPDPADSVIVLD